MLVGLTGCSGSGASTVAGIWKSLGAEVCSLDAAGHRFLDKRGCAVELQEGLGIPGLGSMGSSDIRKTLRERAFADPDLLKGINAVLHPRLRRWAGLAAATLKGGRGIFVLDAALLFELGIDTLADFTVTVRDTMERSAARIAERDGLTEGTALGRWRSQMDIHEKCARSHFVIENRGTITELHNIASDIFINVLTTMNTEE